MRFYIESQYILGINDAPSGLRKFLATESSLKMVKNAFNFILKAIFILKFLSQLSGRVEKQIDQKDVIAWLANNCNTHIAKYLKK